MQFKRQSQSQLQSEVSVNLTPLIDVVFLLLIFFMVSTSFVKDTQLTINLPKADTNEQRAELDVLEVVIDHQGVYTIAGKTLLDVSDESLNSALKNLSANDMTTPIAVIADADAPYNAVVRLIDRAGALGFSKVHIATQAKTE